MEGEALLDQYLSFDTTCKRLIDKDAIASM